MTVQLVCSYLSVAFGSFFVGACFGRAQATKAKRDFDKTEYMRGSYRMWVNSRVDVCPHCRGESRMTLVGNNGESIQAAYCPKCLPPGVQRAKQ